MTEYWCVVCDEPITEDQPEPHAYHGEACPARTSDIEECLHDSYCGDDCHEACCPTCNPL